MASAGELFRRWFSRGRAVPASAAAPDMHPRRRAEFPVFQQYLEARYADTVLLSFGQIEDLLGAALPETARTRASWWTELDGESARYATAWQAAGRTALSNPGARNVTFVRI